MAAGLAQTIEKHTDIKVMVEPSNPTAWTTRMKSGDIDLAILNSWSTYESWTGTGTFAELGKVDIAMLGYGLGSRFVFFTSKDSGIKTIQDLAGKRVMYETPGTPSANQGGKWVLEYYGLMDKINLQPGGSTLVKARALIEGRTDAYWCPVGTHMMDVASAVGLVVLDIPEECSNAAHEKYSWWMSDYVYAGEYGLKEDHLVMNIINNFYCLRTLSESTVYAIMKAVYDHPDELKAIHRAVGDWNLERAVRVPQVIPFHPGAIKYYQEKGVWTEELEAMQKELLAK